MSKVERKRTMVYSNVHKKADFKSASKKNEFSDFDNEVFIGVKSFPKPNEVNKKRNNSKKGKSGQAVDNIKKNNQNQTNKTNKANNKVIENEKKKGLISLLKRKKEKQELEDVREIESIKDQEIEIEVEPTEKEQKPKKQVKKIVVKDNVQKPKLTKEQKIRLQKLRIIKRLSIVLLLIILLIGGTIYFILSPAFNVKAIDVVNNNKISSEQIVSMSEISLNNNMFKFSKKDVKNKILSNPYIEDINVSRNIFTNKVTIDVKERTATLMLEYGNSYVYINNQGYILEISPIKLDSPIIKGYVTPLEDVKPGNRLGKDDLERLEVVLKILETAQAAGLEKLITQINIKNKKDYVMVLESEDKTVYLGNCIDLSTQMLYIKEMLQREKGIEGEFFVDMDLNSGNPVFREKV